MAGRVEQSYQLAKEQFAELGVDTERAMAVLRGVPISLNCWQGDDVSGFENLNTGLTGGIAATGNYPGKAQTPEQLRSDLDKALSLIPGTHRLNLHAIYAETAGKQVERDVLEPQHFSNWASWAKSKGMGLDFNPSYFSHPKAADNFTLSSRDEGIRKYWIRHGQACRRIGAYFGKELGTPCITNVWIPDGYKDTPADRKTPREILSRSLDELFAELLDPKHNLDAMEGKLFGLGAESYTVGSHEFYLGYAVKKGKLVCLDAGHYHPTESMADKISSVLCHLPEILLHVSRGVRWDSDHVVTLTDDLRATAEEIVRGGYLQRVHIGIDYFDASINRVAAWVIGTRCMIKSLLIALLEPAVKLREMESAGDYTGRLAMMERAKMLPAGAVWDYYCQREGTPGAGEWLVDVKRYESEVQSKR
ncbi:MAG TPA: L-rhamnose isomerase [Tepidisphaeraceae bacterium]|jgi:L-rhamnose isomerase|nr:L-rhamnose isomerase [Tepidisphaeraceae bacterium]